MSTASIARISAPFGGATCRRPRVSVVSQQLLDTCDSRHRHTGCDLHGADWAAIRRRVQTTTAHATDLVFGAFADLEAMVDEQLRVLRARPDILPVPVHGLVCEPETGRWRQVT